MDLVVAISQSGHAEGPAALAAEAARREAALPTIEATDSPLADVVTWARGIHVAVPVGLAGLVALTDFAAVYFAQALAWIPVFRATWPTCGTPPETRTPVAAVARLAG